MKPSVCLCMMVKDEAPIIKRCLDSVMPFIDCWSIVDTGSIDKTREIALMALDRIPGKLTDREWRNFGWNRTDAIERAKAQGADYIMIIDADEVLSVDPGVIIPPASGLDSYLFFQHELGGVFRYARKQLIRSDIGWKYVGVTHEYLTADREVTEAVLPGVRTMAMGGGAREGDPLRYRRDALLLEGDLLHDPDNVRSVFYLAQSYRDCGEYESSIRHYSRRASMGGWDEEAWYALYQVAEVRARRGDPWPLILEDYLKAWSFRPSRAEPLYRIGKYYSSSKNFPLAHHFLRTAMSIPYPASDVLFIDAGVYEVFLPMEYAVSCYYAGDHGEAMRVNRGLLSMPSLPVDLRGQVERNLQFSLEAVQ